MTSDDRNTSIFLHRAYNPMCHQSPIKNSNIHSLGDWRPLITFIATSVCNFYVVKLVVTRVFSRKNDKIRAYIYLSVVMFPRKFGIGPDKLFTESDL